MEAKGARVRQVVVRMCAVTAVIATVTLGCTLLSPDNGSASRVWVAARLEGAEVINDLLNRYPQRDATDLGTVQGEGSGHGIDEFALDLHDPGDPAFIVINRQFPSVWRLHFDGRHERIAGNGIHRSTFQLYTDVLAKDVELRNPRKPIVAADGRIYFVEDSGGTPSRSILRSVNPTDHKIRTEVDLSHVPQKGTNVALAIRVTALAPDTNGDILVAGRVSSGSPVIVRLSKTPAVSLAPASNGDALVPGRASSGTHVGWSAQRLNGYLTLFGAGATKRQRRIRPPVLFNDLAVMPDRQLLVRDSAGVLHFAKLGATNFVIEREGVTDLGSAVTVDVDDVFPVVAAGGGVFFHEGCRIYFLGPDASDRALDVLLQRAHAWIVHRLADESKSRKADALRSILAEAKKLLSPSVAIGPKSLRKRELGQEAPSVTAGPALVVNRFRRELFVRELKVQVPDWKRYISTEELAEFVAR